MLSGYFESYCARYAPYKGGAWCYEDGCIYRGLDLLATASGHPRWWAHLRRLADAQIAPDGALAGYDPDACNIDNILPGRVLFSLSRATRDARYLAAADRLIAQLDQHPRIAAGNYWHKRRYPQQVWLDGLYMALPFQAEYGLARGQPARISDALAQLTSALNLTPAPAGLQVHGYDDSRAQDWADPVSGKSPAVWARAMGWLAMALVDVLGILPDGATTTDLRQRTAAILSAIAAQQGSGGLWPQVLDASALAGNYEETSASAMFAYAFLRAARLGVVTGEVAAVLRDIGLQTLQNISETRIVDQQLIGICHVAGLGAMGGRYRDGSPGYYLTEPVVVDDAKGVGPLMMAYAESLLIRSAL